MSIEAMTEAMTMEREAAPPAFELSLQAAGSTLLATVSGPLDLQSAPHVLSRLEVAVPAVRRLVLDLRGADYVDSTGVRALLELRRKLESCNTELWLAIRGGSRVERVLKLLQLEGQFQICEDVNERLLRADMVC
jgi:anti-anti-sigma factor